MNAVSIEGSLSRFFDSFTHPGRGQREYLRRAAEVYQWLMNQLSRQ